MNSAYTTKVSINLVNNQSPSPTDYTIITEENFKAESFYKENNWQKKMLTYAFIIFI